MRKANSEDTLTVTPVIAHVTPNPHLKGYRKVRTRFTPAQRVDMQAAPMRPMSVRGVIKRILMGK